jgi:hypothetical protein
VASKPTASAWAEKHLDEQWKPLVERAWEGRHSAGLQADPDDIQETLRMIRYLIQISQP